MKKISQYFRTHTAHGFVYLVLIAVVIFLVTKMVTATTPNPGHPWTDIGNGTFQVANTQTLVRTFTFPDADATMLTSNAAVTVAQGGTGAATLTGILKGNGTSAFTAVTAPAGNILGDTDTQTLTNKTISKASNTLTGVAASGANSDITALSGLTTALSVGQGGTGANTLTSNNVILGNGATAVQFVAPSTSGNVLASNGTTWVSTLPANLVLYSTQGLYPANLTTVTALTTGVSYFQYMGVAPKAYTTCTVLQNVTTAAATITWAEVAVFKGNPVLNGAASLTRLGSANVAATYNSIGRKSTAVTVAAVTGDNLWVAFGSSATTPFQVRGMLADDLQSGVFQTATIQPSLAASPQATVLGGATVVPAWVSMRCQ
ncbi:MAG TPA: hypothetical protein VGT41_05980 [Candidatus Babeliales bacterium]|nr:hypothetical protein [Candidatus Babeliales bacterium]